MTRLSLALHILMGGSVMYRTRLELTDKGCRIDTTKKGGRLKALENHFVGEPVGEAFYHWTPGDIANDTKICH